MSAWVANALAAEELSLGPHDKRLQSDARAQIAQGLRIRRLTLAVIDALARESVTPTLLKGAGLAQRLFPEQPLARPSTDVDVLVTPSELDAAKRAMQALGLTPQVDPSLADAMVEHHHLSFASRDRLVDVHFRLFSGFGGRTFDDQRIRERLVPGNFEGRAVRWLSSGDEFVYLATHAANHGFLRASWLLDLQRYLALAPDLEWEVLAEQCRQAGFYTAVAASLWLLEHALEVRLPAGARAFRAGLARRAGMSLLFSPAQLESAALAQHRLGGFALRVWLADSPRDGIRHVALGARRWWRQVRLWGRHA